MRMGKKPTRPAMRERTIELGGVYNVVVNMEKLPDSTNALIELNGGSYPIT